MNTFPLEAEHAAAKQTLVARIESALEDAARKREGWWAAEQARVEAADRSFADLCRRMRGE